MKKKRVEIQDLYQIYTGICKEKFSNKSILSKGNLERMHLFYTRWSGNDSSSWCGPDFIVDNIRELLCIDDFLRMNYLSLSEQSVEIFNRKLVINDESLYELDILFSEMLELCGSVFGSMASKTRLYIQLPNVPTKGIVGNKP